MVSIWALAAALVPEMQKGNNNARSAHIALNVANTLLFVSQVPTGLDIVGKVRVIWGLRCGILGHKRSSLSHNVHFSPSYRNSYGPPLYRSSSLLHGLDSVRRTPDDSVVTFTA
jgi:hypothetical protein